MLQFKVLVGELVAVDRLATATIARGEVTTLDPASERASEQFTHHTHKYASVRTTASMRAAYIYCLPGTIGPPLTTHMKF